MLRIQGKPCLRQNESKDAMFGCSTKMCAEMFSCMCGVVCHTHACAYRFDTWHVHVLHLASTVHHVVALFTWLCLRSLVEPPG